MHALPQIRPPFHMKTVVLAALRHALFPRGKTRRLHACPASEDPRLVESQRVFMVVDTWLHTGSSALTGEGASVLEVARLDAFNEQGARDRAIFLRNVRHCRLYLLAWRLGMSERAWRRDLHMSPFAA